MKIHLFACLVALIPMTAFSATVSYDASLGTLPEFQGWTRHNTEIAPEPYVQDNALCMEASEGGELLWTKSITPINYGVGSSLSFEMKFNSLTGTYAPPDGGFYIGFSSENKYYTLQFTADLLLINYGETFLSYDPVGDYRRYDVKFTTTGLELYVDDVWMNTSQWLTSPVGGSALLYFGDLSYDSEADVQIRSVTLEAVPEPFILLGLAALAGFAAKRKR